MVEVTQTFLQCTFLPHEPFRNKKFGPPCTCCRPQHIDGDHDLEMVAEVCSVDRGADLRVKLYF